MHKGKLMEQYLKYKDKTMDELIEERSRSLLKGINELRKKWLPERYDERLDK